MKKATRILTGVLCAVLVGASAGAFAGCGGNDETVSITVTGSTSVQPLMIKLAAEYEKTRKNVEIDVGGGGSGAGVTDAKDGKNDFGMASRELKDSETGVVSRKIADDGIALIVNNNCAVTNVTKAEVKALYESGTVIRDVIKGALSRENGSGTRDAFHELIGISSLYKGTGFEEGLSQTNAVITKIKTNASGAAGFQVGYISMGSLTNDIKCLDFEGVAPTAANVKSGAYALARPFNIIYISESSLSAQAKAFIDWIVSAEGQAVVENSGYIRL